MEKTLRTALLAAGTIAQLVLEQARAGELAGIDIVGIAGRRKHSTGAALAKKFDVPYVVGREALLALQPQVVVEAASHDALREHLVPLLRAGASVIVLSVGALTDDRLRKEAEAAAGRSGALFYVPSGGIGGLDALRTPCLAGVDEVSIQVAKPPVAWPGIPYVESLGLALDWVLGPTTYFDGAAPQGVPHFPQNVNIAAEIGRAHV